MDSFKKNARKIIDTYIEPSLSSFKNLNKMVKCLTSNTTYVKQIIQKENLPYESEFTIAAINTDKGELYFFTVR